MNVMFKYFEQICKKKTKKNNESVLPVEKYRM